jgi:hypothetical protein
MELYIDYHEMASDRGVSTGTIERWRREDPSFPKVRAYRGRRVLFDRQDWQAWIAAGGRINHIIPATAEIRTGG